MKLSAFLFLLVLAPTSTLAQSSDITIWPKGMPPEGITKKIDFGGHALSISHREKDGLVEVHENKADVMVIQSGTAKLVVGGKIIDPVTIAPHEIHGVRLEGGTSRNVGPGDVIEIPAGVPHQFFLNGAPQITYLLVKIVKQ